MAYLNTPLNFQSIVAPYIGGKEQVFAESSKQLQDLYYANEAKDFERNLLFANAKTIEGDDAAKNRVASEMESILGNAARDVKTGNMRYELAGNYIADATRRMITDQDFINEQESYKNYLKARELQESLKAQGLNPLDFRPPTGWNTKEMGVFTSGVEAEMRWDEKAKSFFSDLMPDAVRHSLANITDTELANAIAGKTTITSGYKGISYARIKNYVDNIYGTYEATPEGQQRFRNLTEIQGLAPEVARKQMKEELLAIGRRKVHSERIEAQQDDIIQIARARAGGRGDDKPTAIPYIRTKASEQLPLGGEATLNQIRTAASKGDTKNIETYNLVRNSMLDAFVKSNPKYEEVRDKEKSFLDNLSKINPILGVAAQNLIQEAWLIDNPYKNVGLFDIMFNEDNVNDLKDELLKLGVKPAETKDLLDKFRGVKDDLDYGRLYYMYKDFKDYEGSLMSDNTVLTLGVDTKPEVRNRRDDFISQYSLGSDFNIVGMPKNLPTDVKGEDLLKSAKYNLVGPFAHAAPGIGVILQVEVPYTENGVTSNYTFNVSPKADRYEQIVDELETIYGNDLKIKDNLGKSNLAVGIPVSKWDYNPVIEGKPMFTPDKNKDFVFTGKAGEYQAMDVNTKQPLTLYQIYDKALLSVQDVNEALYNYLIRSGGWSLEYDMTNPQVQKMYIDKVNQVKDNTTFGDYNSVMLPIMKSYYGN